MIFSFPRPAFFKSRETMITMAIILLLGIVWTRFPDFITGTSLISVFNDTSLLIILALGQMIVIVARCIDLSVAANLALTGMVVAMINAAAPDIPMGFLLIFAVMLGAFLGLLNGLLVWLVSIPPIVVTLGTMTIFRGLIFIISDGQWVNAHEMSDAFKAFPRELMLGLPVLSWFAIGVILLFSLLTVRTPLGRAFFAVGGNPQAAVYAGINSGWVQMMAFVICGALAGLAGYLWVARYAVAYVDIAGGFELEVVAACVIGGISIAGGIGSVAGVVLGALFLGVIKNALPVVGISPFWQLAISGTAIIIAVAFNARSMRRQGRLILREQAS